MTEEQLIEAVKRRKVLYDMNDSCYMKSKLKNRIWNDISTELSMENGEEAKTMWMKLRGSYRDARRRQLRSMRSGASPEHIKRWKFQKQMSFLEHFMTTGPREGNLNYESDENSQLQSQLTMKVAEEVDSMTGECAGHSSQIETDDNFLEDDEERTDFKHEIIDAGNDKERTIADFSSPSALAKTQVNDFHGLLHQSMQQHQERLRKRTEDRNAVLEQHKTTDDPLYNFFLSMYQLTKTFPPEYQHKVRADVFQSVSEAEADIMNINTFRRPTSTFSSSHDSTASSNTTTLNYS